MDTKLGSLPCPNFYPCRVVTWEPLMGHCECRMLGRAGDGSEMSCRDPGPEIGSGWSLSSTWVVFGSEIFLRDLAGLSQ